MEQRETGKLRNRKQKELAQRSGVNFRSAQDDEQEHKKRTSANGDALPRLSTVLGCTTEDLLLDDMNGALRSKANCLDMLTAACVV